jgi:hypothetical protein
MDKVESKQLNDQRRSCPLRGNWISFRLVDEFGEGKPYAGLSYELTDIEGGKKTGTLDAEGFARIEGNYAGPAILVLVKKYNGADDFYKFIAERNNYKIPVTELQAAAEQTLRRPVGSREKTGGTIESRPQDRATAFQRRATMSDLQERQTAIRQAVKHNQKELEALEVTLRTITRLSSTTLTMADIYGDCAALPELQTHIDRWAAHTENQKSERLAQIPKATNQSMA